MTLEEAIEHAEQKAQDLNCSCRADHWQLAQWLKELNVRREVDKTAITNKFLEKNYGTQRHNSVDDERRLY